MAASEWVAARFAGAGVAIAAGAVAVAWVQLRHQAERGHLRA
jgi:hypothetical protein